MSGSEFLAMYFGLLLVACFWSMFRYRSGGQPPMLAQNLQVEHWAVLSGGLKRAAQADFVGLLQRKELMWNMERKEFESLDGNAVEVAAKLENLENLHRVYERQLEAWGLLHAEKDALNRQFTVSLPFIFLLFLGLARVVQGFINHKPVGFLIAFLVVTLVIWTYFVKTIPRVTKEGRDLLMGFKKEKDHILRATPASELPLAVALLGMTALQGTIHAPLAWAMDPKRTLMQDNGDGTYNFVTSCSSGSSGCGSGVGGGDGGGDGGGSGCGGCGGGD